MIVKCPKIATNHGNMAIFELRNVFNKILNCKLPIDLNEQFEIKALKKNKMPIFWIFPKIFEIWPDSKNFTLYVSKQWQQTMKFKNTTL